MKSLLSREGQAALRALRPHETLFAFDYDGTLAPIRGVPGGARVPRATERALVQLCDEATVAIISGRARADVKSRLNFKPQFVIGSHGAEGLPGEVVRVAQAKKICRTWSVQVARYLESHPLNGVSTEKKLCSLTMHYRFAANRAQAKLELARLAAKLTPAPRRVLGKCVVDFIPEGLPHKGDALRAIMLKTGLKKAIYLGDDETDEDVFRLHHKNILSVRVGHKSSSAADFYVDRPSDVGRLVQSLVSRLKVTRLNSRSSI